MCREAQALLAKCVDAATKARALVARLEGELSQAKAAAKEADRAAGRVSALVSDLYPDRPAVKVPGVGPMTAEQEAEWNSHAACGGCKNPRLDCVCVVA